MSAMRRVTAIMGGRAAVVLAAGALALGATACGGDDEETGAGTNDGATATSDQQEGMGVEPVEVTLAELVAQPEDYLGERVTVSGAVLEADLDEDPSVPAIFTLGPTAEDDLLVLPTEQADIPSAELAPDEVVEVEGRLVEFTEDLGESEDLLYETVEGGLLPNAEDAVALVANYVELDADAR